MTHGERRYLGLRIADRSCLVDLKTAGELITVPLSLTAIPLARPWLLGLFSIRGQLFTLIDLARYRGWSTDAPRKFSRALAFGPSLQCSVALLVDEVHGLHDPETPLEEDARHWEMLDLAALIREPAFATASRLMPVMAGAQ